MTGLLQIPQKIKKTEFFPVTCVKLSHMLIRYKVSRVEKRMSEFMPIIPAPGKLRQED